MDGLSGFNFGSLGGSGSMGALLSGLVGSSSNPVLQPKGFNGADLSAFQNFFGGNNTSAAANNPSFPSNLNLNSLTQQGGNSSFNPNFGQMGQQMGQMMPNSVFAPNDPGFNGTIYPPEQAFAFMDQFFAQQFPPIWQSSQMVMNNGMNSMNTMNTMQTGMQQNNWNTGWQVNNTPINNPFGSSPFGNTGFQQNTMGFGGNTFGGFDPMAMYGGYNQGFDPNAMYGGYNQGFDPNAMYGGYGAQDDGSAEMLSMISSLQGMIASLGSSQQQAPVSAIPPGTGGIKPPKPVTTPLPSPVQPPPAVTPPTTTGGGDDAAILAMLQGLGLTGATT